jgi:CRISP-associated protein Cas1
MLIHRLGLDTARIPHSDRYGLLWLEYGNLVVEDGNLHFIAAKSLHMDAGNYAIPFQNISIFLMGPGTTVSHDALRLLAIHKCGLIAVGENGVRMYSAHPLGPNDSLYARNQAQLWSNPESRLFIARKMYALRLNEIFPEANINVLRGIEGARMKEIYAQLANRYQIKWHGRKYDRINPDSTDLPNQAINHAATAVEAAAAIAVAVTGTIPQLGFIHEDSSNAFILDIADLFRHNFTIPIAFEAIKLIEKDHSYTIDRHVRKLAGKTFKEKKLISKMIDSIKELIIEEPIST